MLNICLIITDVNIVNPWIVNICKAWSYFTGLKDNSDIHVFHINANLA